MTRPLLIGASVVAVTVRYERASGAVFVESAADDVELVLLALTKAQGACLVGALGMVRPQLPNLAPGGNGV